MGHCFLFKPSSQQLAPEPKPTVEIRPSSIQADLGIPTNTISQSQSKLREGLTALAATDLEFRFPDLVAGPNVPSGIAKRSLTQLDHREISQSYPIWRLYRGVVPPIGYPNRIIAFTGFRATFANTIRVELIAIWIYTYLTHSPTLSVPGAEKRQYTATLDANWAAIRSQCRDGRFCPDDSFDMNAMFDELVGDLEVEVRRLARSWWDVLGVWRVLKKLFGSYETADYRGLVSEWVERDEGMRSDGKTLAPTSPLALSESESKWFKPSAAALLWHSIHRP